MTEITGYHAHIYFDDATVEQAKTLCERARDTFNVEMGRMHHRPVGPHPSWSCQLAFGTESFADVVPWLATHRDGLVVFLHPETGDHVKDHTEHAIWMGAMEEIDVSALI
jgi:DOPA 4,5-dioxygenase